jgi:hypothetical protein
MAQLVDIARGVDFANSQRVTTDERLVAMKLATQEGDVGAVRAIMESHRDLPFGMRVGIGRDVSTLLETAAIRGHVEVCRCLLDEAGVELTHYAFFAAITYGKIDVVRFFGERGADKNHCDEFTGMAQSPLAEAASQGHMLVVRYLCENGANFRDPPPLGPTPLYVASFKGHYAIVEYLLTIGVNANIGNTRGRTGALHGAALGGHEDVIELLLSHGCDVNQKDVTGISPLYCTVLMQQIGAARLLLARGADIRCPDVHGKSAIDAARTEVFRQLLLDEEHRRNNHGFKRAIRPEDMSAVAIEDRASKRPRVEGEDDDAGAGDDDVSCDVSGGEGRGGCTDFPFSNAPLSSVFCTCRTTTTMTTTTSPEPSRRHRP